MKLYAFWKYDLFPYVLGGEVVEMRDDGRVLVKGYGPGFWFKPIRLVPVKTGKAIKKKLDEIEARHNKAQKKLKDEAMAEVTKVLAVDEQP